MTRAREMANLVSTAVSAAGASFTGDVTFDTPTIDVGAVTAVAVSSAGGGTFPDITNFGYGYGPNYYGSDLTFSAGYYPFTQAQVDFLTALAPGDLVNLTVSGYQYTSTVASTTNNILSYYLTGSFTITFVEPQYGYVSSMSTSGSNQYDLTVSGDLSVLSDHVIIGGTQFTSGFTISGSVITFASDPSASVGDAVQYYAPATPGIVGTRDTSTSAIRYDSTNRWVVDDDPVVVGRVRNTGVNATNTVSEIDSGDQNSVVLKTPNTGFLSLATPDGTSAGGNTRGQGALDLQRSRSSASQVASGFNSTLIAGDANTASGNTSLVVGGNQNVGSGGGSTILAGYGNTVSGSSASALAAKNAIIQGIQSVGLGTSARDYGAKGALVHGNSSFGQTLRIVLTRRFFRTTDSDKYINSGGSSFAGADGSYIIPINTAAHIQGQVIIFRPYDAASKSIEFDATVINATGNPVLQQNSQNVRFQSASLTSTGVGFYIDNTYDQFRVGAINLPADTSSSRNIYFTVSLDITEARVN